MPTAFTPNGDGINDIYRIPPHASITLKNLSIYNRWGAKIFTTKDVNKGWDGAIDGQPLSTGTFTYVINGSNASGLIKATGTFVLIR